MLRNIELRSTISRNAKAKASFALVILLNEIVPNVGTKHSQRGNKSFPAWEQNIPTVGIITNP
jgi:hypothetical protein